MRGLRQDSGKLRVHRGLTEPWYVQTTREVLIVVNRCRENRRVAGRLSEFPERMKTGEAGSAASPGNAGTAQQERPHSSRRYEGSPGYQKRRAGVRDPSPHQRGRFRKRAPGPKKAAKEQGPEDKNRQTISIRRKKIYTYFEIAGDFARRAVNSNSCARPVRGSAKAPGKSKRHPAKRMGSENNRPLNQMLTFPIFPEASDGAIRVRDIRALWGGSSAETAPSRQGHIGISSELPLPWLLALTPPQKMRRQPLDLSPKEEVPELRSSGRSS